MNSKKCLKNTDEEQMKTSKNVIRKYRARLAVLIGLSVIAMALIGCSPMNLGRDFPVEKVGSIKIGVTTRAEIRERFGSPWRTGIEDGMSTWTFGYYSYDFSGKGLGRDLMIKFNKAGIVRSYAFNTTETGETLKPESE